MRFSKVRDVKTPTRGTSGSAGIDFYVPSTFGPINVEPDNDILIPSGIKVDIPHGYMLMGADKSGIATTRRACVLADRQPKPDAFNSSVILGAKIVDEDYQGEIWIHLINVGCQTIRIEPGAKIAQFVLVPVEYVELEGVPENELFNHESERGEGGFGSTNQK